MFDASLVLLMVVETWVITVVIVLFSGDGVGLNISILRLLRLVRLSRLSRIIRAVPELSFMVKGVLEAARSVAGAMFLLLGFLYVFGIVLRQLSDGTDMGKRNFSSVPHSVFTLFARATLLDGIAELFMDAWAESSLCAILILIVVIATALTLMNMLLGVLCEVMTNVSQAEKEKMANNFASEQITMALAELDKDHDGCISKEEFEHIITNAKAAQALVSIGVDLEALIEFADFFFQSDKHGETFDHTWPFEKFMERIMEVRGENPPTVKDLVKLQKFIHAENTDRNLMLKSLQANQATLAANQAKMARFLNPENRGSLYEVETLVSIQCGEKEAASTQENGTKVVDALPQQPTASSTANMPTVNEGEDG
jgi:hypothetical protein